MRDFNEYSAQLAIRSSDMMSAATSASSEPMISSGTWGTLAEGFDTGAKAFAAVGVAATYVGADKVAKAAGATSVMAKLASDLAKQQQVAAKAQEKAAADKKAFDRAMREGADRAMKDHMDRMGRGDYRDPPSAGRMAEIGRMA